MFHLWDMHDLWASWTYELATKERKETVASILASTNSRTNAALIGELRAVPTCFRLVHGFIGCMDYSVVLCIIENFTTADLAHAQVRRHKTHNGYLVLRAWGQVWCDAKIEMDEIYRAVSLRVRTDYRYVKICLLVLNFQDVPYAAISELPDSHVIACQMQQGQIC
jgi:hypothetical protein